MKDNWKEITDPEELFKLKREGWEIETNTPIDGYPWKAWLGEQWNSFHIYRARPPKPKMKKVKLLAWIDGNGWIHCGVEGSNAHEYAKCYEEWIRQPHLDLEAEVPDEQ